MWDASGVTKDKKFYFKIFFLLNDSAQKLVSAAVAMKTSSLI